MSHSSSVDKEEVDRFSVLANDWWAVGGAFSPLHKLNSARLEYIRGEVVGRFANTSHDLPLGGLSVLDIGCGGGLLCEPLAVMGAKVTGIDASSEAIEVAKKHALKQGVGIKYIHGSAEEYASAGKKFDVVTVLEIIEHAADVDSLLGAAASLLKPGGILIVSTVNRTVRSYLLGVIAAEYILRWVPTGTHDWRRFMRPSELVDHLEGVGMRVCGMSGMIYSPVNDSFYLQKGKIGVNYIISAVAA